MRGSATSDLEFESAKYGDSLLRKNLTIQFPIGILRNIRGVGSGDPFGVFGEVIR
jgi:hypothetical protein